MRIIRMIVDWLFSEPEFDLKEMTDNNRLLLAAMREDLW